MTTTGMKKIFISDIHMGDARSLGGTTPYPYNRFLENIKHLARFLNKQLEATDLEQVVILGDLFDTWVIPTNQNPLNSFQAICKTLENEDVITALKTLAANGKLTYIQGNHDMVLSSAEQSETQQFMKSTFDGIDYTADPNRVYRNGTIVGEHGHRYALFNAPNTMATIKSFLPIGYFISRLEAYKKATTGKEEDFLVILKEFIIKYIIDREGPVHDLFVAMAQDANLEGTDNIHLNGIDGFPVQQVEPIGKVMQVDAVGALYNPLMEKWQGNPDTMTWRQAVVGDIGQLLLAAIIAYLAENDSDQNIVIFGHTHKAELWKSYDLPLLNHLIRHELVKHLDKILNDLKKDLPIPDLEIWDRLKAYPMWPKLNLPSKLTRRFKLPCRSIYVNSGSWVDKRPCTYVETQEDVKAERHYVRLRQFHPKEKLLQEEFVELKK